MKEVSSKVFDVKFRALQKKGIAPEALVEGTSTSLATLRNKHERIDWQAYVEIMANARKLFTDDEYVALGGAFFRSRVIQSFTVVARLLFTARDFYRWVNSPGRGVGHLMFSCIEASYQELDRSRIAVELTLPEELEVCWDFFVITTGTFIDMPRLLALPPAAVELTRIPRGGGT